ncbi:hypothetical protein AKJ36_03530, partial [candidate division MSBL1 archaeon SCGC-AAA259I07]
MRREKQEAEKKLNYLKERHARLWNKYRKVTSSNKPSSKKTRYEKEEEKRRKRERKKRRKGDEDTGGKDGEDEGKGKPGRKPGHEPAWREKLEPEEEIDVTQDRCDICGNLLGDPIGQHSRVIEDIPDPLPPTSKQFNVFEYYCETCDKKVVATDPDCPETGDFGPNTLVQTTLFKFEYRLPYRKVSDLFDTLYGFNISEASVLASAERVANYLDPYYEEVKTELRDAEAIHVDETSFSVGGKGWWLWSFSNGKYVLYRLVNSRSSGVLEEVLGEDFDGWIICDGLSAYPAFTEKLQRCWSHLFRKVEDVPDKYEEILPIDKKLHEIYNHLNEFLEGDPPPQEREE